MSQSEDDTDVHIFLELGSLLGGRYRVLGALGQGTFGKVVKVKDINSKMILAVKVSLKRRSGRYWHSKIPKLARNEKSMDGYDIGKQEVEMLKKLNQLDPKQKELVIKLFDSFEMEGRVCAVIELLSISVYDFQVANAYKPFPADHVQHIGFQLCHALQFLHNKQILHTDIKPENVVLVCGNYDEVRDLTCEDNTNSKSKRATIRILKKTHIRIIDFGSALDISRGKQNNFKISTREYRCVESVLGISWGPPADMWSAGCTIFDMYCGFTLFDKARNDSGQLTMMELYLGPLPDMFLKVAPKEFMEKKISNPSIMKSEHPENKIYDLNPQKLFRYFGFDEVPGEGSHRIYSLVARMLEYDPQMRLTAKAALEHPAFLTLAKNLKKI